MIFVSENIKKKEKLYPLESRNLSSRSNFIKTSIKKYYIPTNIVIYSSIKLIFKGFSVSTKDYKQTYQQIPQFLINFLTN